MAQVCPQRHHAHRRTDQQVGQVEQVIGIGPPAVQQHQPLLAAIRATSDHAGVGSAS